jgi:LysR family transcriptional regulator, benzoate and cis,cis-muconate-responsive activator of ben and cat genes
MELRQLQYFVAVAEELHFSRASVRLNLAQSALSSQIRQLERELGGPLLKRTTRRVELTPAGEALLADGQEILAAVDGAVTRARALARGESGVLTIGSLGPAPGGVLAPLLARFGERHPDVRVEVRAFDFPDMVAGLRERRADVAFLYLPLDEPDLVATPLLSEQRVVVVPRTHRLARRKTLRPADLDGETFVTHPDSTPESWRDFWLLVDELGHRPPVSPHTAEKAEQWLHLIGRGEGIDTAPAIISRYYAWPEVVFIPLVDAAPATLALAGRRDAEADRLTRDFVELAVEIASTAAENAATPYGAVPDPTK